MEPGKGKDLGAWENVQKGHENGLVRPRVYMNMVK